jgi:hypothetical protein
MDNASPESQKSMVKQLMMIERPFLMLVPEPLLGADMSVDAKRTRVQDETTYDN